MPLFSNNYVRNLTHGHSSRWALLVDEILALPRVAGGKTPGALADQMLLASGPVEKWGHLFDLLQHPHAEYVESRSTLPIESGDPADGNGDGTLDKGEVSQLGEGDLLRIFSINPTRGTHGDEAVAYHYLLRETPDMVQLGVIGAVVVTCSMFNRPDILEAFLTSKGTIDPNGLYRVLVLMAQDPSEMVGDVATVVVENLTPRQREVLAEIDRKESGGKHQALLMGQTTRDLTPFEKSPLPRATFENFETTIMEESVRRPVFVIVGAGWCGVCNASTPHVEALAKKYGGRISTVVVDTEKEPEMKEYLSTGRIPLFLLIRNGNVVQAQEGFSDPDELEAMIRRGLPQEL